DPDGIRDSGFGTRTGEPRIPNPESRIPTASASHYLFRGPQRQRHERERAVRAPSGRRRRRADDEQILVVVRAAETVADAGGRIGAHSAAAAGMIEIVAFAVVDNSSVTRCGQPREHALDVGARGCL